MKRTSYLVITNRQGVKSCLRENRLLRQRLGFLQKKDMKA